MPSLPSVVQCHIWMRGGYADLLPPTRLLAPRPRHVAMQVLRASLPQPLLLLMLALCAAGARQRPTATRTQETLPSQPASAPSSCRAQTTPSSTACAAWQVRLVRCSLLCCCAGGVLQAGGACTACCAGGGVVDGTMAQGGRWESNPKKRVLDQHPHMPPFPPPTHPRAHPPTHITSRCCSGRQAEPAAAGGGAVRLRQAPHLATQRRALRLLHWCV